MHRYSKKQRRDSPEEPAAAAAPIALLPEEILACIFAFLGIPDRCRLRRVCRAWKAVPLEPLWGPSLQFTLPCRGLPIGVLPQGAGPEASTAEDPSALAEATFLASLRAALGSPLAAGLSGATVALEEEPRPAPSCPRQQRRWPLAEALGALALPASVTALSLAAPAARPPSEPERAALRVALRGRGGGLQGALPGLLELRICGQLAPLFLSPAEHEASAPGEDPPLHAALRRLDAGRGVPPCLLVDQLPALVRLESMLLDADTATSDLRRLADRGLKVRSLCVDGFDPASRHEAAAVAAVFRPAAFDWPLPGLSRLRIDSHVRRDVLGALPSGVQQVEMRAVGHGVLPWLAEIVGRTDLCTLTFKRSCLARVPPVDLLRTLRGAHVHLDVVVEWPTGRGDPESDPMPMPGAPWAWFQTIESLKRWLEALARAVAFLKQEPPVLAAVRLELDGLLATVQDGSLEDWSPDGGVGSRELEVVDAAVDWLAARCGAVAARRPWLPLDPEFRALSAIHDRLDAACGEDDGEAWRLERLQARLALGRCRRAWDAYAALEAAQAATGWPGLA